MYITLYFGNKPVFLCDQRETALETLYHRPDTIVLEEDSPSAVHTLLSEIEKPEINAGILQSAPLEKLKHHFFHSFTVIIAAGGIVVNDLQEVLLIFRRGKWDLPKGKLDEGESIEACAVREVQEETGLKNVQILKPMPDTYHTYQEFGKKILKQSCWFRMHAPGVQALKPQTEEDITEIKWVPVQELNAYTSQTYPSVKDVLKAFLNPAF